MSWRRLQYFVLLLGVGAYFVASGEWLSWILLLVTAGLPWLSLVISLPAMLSFGMEPAGVDRLESGEEADLWLLGSSRYPMPPFKGRIRLRCLLDGEEWDFLSDDGFPTDHCGGYRAWVRRAKVCDYLGIFSLRVRNTAEQVILVRPKPVPVEDLTDPKRLEIERWVPKPGGGFAENHEHRLYRPGDSLNQLHWKLSAKVGDLIVREPMVPLRGAVLVTVSVCGDADELDSRFGKLLWVGRFLLEKELDFEIRALTGDGILHYSIRNESELMDAVDALLCRPRAERDSDWHADLDASWQYHIGGAADEK